MGQHLRYSPLQQRLCATQVSFLFDTLTPFLFEPPGETQRRPRARAPKVEKPEEAAKGRKRKKPMKQDAKEASDAAGPSAGELDPIMATIEAVLANAASIDTSVEKLKKMRRTKKCQETPKQDGEKSAEDDEDNDGSTAGKVTFYCREVESRHRLLIQPISNHVRLLSLQQVKPKAGGLPPRSRFSSLCNMGNVSFRNDLSHSVGALFWC